MSDGDHKENKELSRKLQRHLLDATTEFLNSNGLSKRDGSTQAIMLSGAMAVILAMAVNLNIPLLVLKKCIMDCIDVGINEGFEINEQ